MVQLRIHTGATWKGRLKSIALRLYRLAVVIAIVAVVRYHTFKLQVEGDDPIALPEVVSFFPAAAKLDVDTSERAGFWVLDRTGKRLGYVLRTSPMSDGIKGYSGPTDTLIALTPDKASPQVLGIKVRYSSDTREHVADVIADEGFMGTWNGWTWDKVAGTDPRAAGIEGVSGASLTSLCIANGIKHRFEQADANARLVKKEAATPIRIHAADVGVTAVIVAAGLFTFTHFRRRTWLRRVFQALLIGYVGFYSGQLLALSLFAGWAQGGLPWRAAPGLALLAAAALIVPWATRRPMYCGQICPHGAAQELLGRLTHRWLKRPLRAPLAIDRGLRWAPPLLIAMALLVTMQMLPIDLAGIEPFDAYLVRTAGRATILVAVIGLAVSAFVPMAYCKYGCPTGAVLSFVRSHGEADRFSRRDLVAGMLVLMTTVLFIWHRSIHLWIVAHRW